MNFTSVKKTYQRYAPVYDMLFGGVLNPGRIRLAKQVAQLEADNLLEVGVGTGLMLPQYPKTTHCVGIDVSEPMLEKAKKLVLKKQLENVTLLHTNSEILPFDSNTFACVTLPYVYSVTENPSGFIQECWRVCKPGGSLLILNHFSDTDNGYLWKLLEFLSVKMYNIIGFNSQFTYKENISDLNWNVVSVEPVNFANLSRLIHIKKSE